MSVSKADSGPIPSNTTEDKDNMARQAEQSSEARPNDREPNESQRMSTPTSPAPAAPEPLGPVQTWMIIGVVAFTTVMSSGGHQGLNIALPVIQQELNILESNLQWVSSAYALTWGCFLLLAGRIADVYGRKWCFIAGIAWYALWCLVGSFMNSGAALIVTRALAGAGAALGIPASMGLIHTNIHGKQRATAFAVFSAGAPLGGALGITFGGVLTAYSSSTWRAILWIFTGLAVLIAAVAWLVVPDDHKKRARGEPRREEDKIDWLGAAMVTCGLVLVQFTVSDGMSAPKGWRTPYIPTLFVVGVLLIVAFFCWEYYIIHHTPRAPLLRLALFTRARGRLACLYFVGFVMWMGFISIGYHATLYYQQVQMTGTIGALLRYLPAPICGIICNVIISKIVHKLPGQVLICTGLGATGLSATFMAVSKRDTMYWTFPFNAMWLMVVGADFLMPVGTIFVSRMALPQEQSVAGALFQTLLQLGGSFGLTLTTVIATAMQDRATAKGKEHVEALLIGFQASFWLSAALCFTAMLLAAATLHGIGIVTQEKKATVSVDTVETGGEVVVLPQERQGVEVAGEEKK